MPPPREPCGLASPAVLLPSLGAVVVLLVLSAFFASSESAVFSLPDGWAPTGAAAERPEARVLDRLRSNPHRVLVTLLVGNNLVNIALTSIATLAIADVVRPGLAVVASTVGVGVLVLVFGEIVPKAYGLGHAETWSLRVARPIRVVELALGPLVTLFDAVTGRLTAAIGGDAGIEETYLGD